MRLRSDFWVAAYIRRCNGEGAPAVLRHRGALEAGAIFVVLDTLAGALALFGPAPQTEMQEDGVDRLFVRMHKEVFVDAPEIMARLARQMSFDPDAWIVDVEDRQGRHFLDLA